ncbi:MAG: hypothetical protein ABIF08_00295 [Nanoarchaeota archaeon]
MRKKFEPEEPSLSFLAEQSGFCDFYGSSVGKFEWMRSVIKTDNFDIVYFRRNNDDAYESIDRSFNASIVHLGTAAFLCVDSSDYHEPSFYQISIAEMWKAKEEGQEISLDSRQEKYTGEELYKHLAI